tara:strand:- start:284 stop:523 length:240 start_codon:yes stop_codon:yes gene_type:complete
MGYSTSVPKGDFMDYSKEQLIDCLLSEYVCLLQDDDDETLQWTEEEFREWLNSLSVEQLIEETGTDEVFPLSEFMYSYS